MIAARIGKTVDYVLLAERELPEDQKTIFKLAVVSAAGRAKIQNSLTGYERATDLMRHTPGDGNLEAVRRGLAGWRNLNDEAGQPVEPRYTGGKGKGDRVLLPSSLDVLPTDVINELGAEVMVINGLLSRDDLNAIDELVTEPGEEEPGNPPAEASKPTSTASASSPPSPPKTPNSKASSSSTAAPVPAAKE